MKANKIAIAACLVACLTIAASSEYQKRGLEDRVSELEQKYEHMQIQWDHLNMLMHYVDNRQTKIQMQVWNLNWILCGNTFGCTNGVFPP